MRIHTMNRRRRRQHDRKRETAAILKREADEMAWICICGHYEESWTCCSYCGHQPPWGCDCSDHDDAWGESDEWDDGACSYDLEDGSPPGLRG
jgi:hypothetical protein